MITEEQNKFYLVNKESDILSSLFRLNNNKDKCLIVVDDEKKLLGTLTDGDIRRAILNGIDFSQSIKKVFNKRPYYLFEGDKKNKSNLSQSLLKNYKVIPVVNKKKKILKIFSLNLNNPDIKNLKSRFKNFNTNVPVVIMAGGEGKRLLPHTSVIPKPLIPFKGKSMIEQVMENFKTYGFNNFIMTLNYKSNLMEAYFSSNKILKKNIKFIHEKYSLGTAGSLKKLNKKNLKNFFVINCDTIIKCDYHSLWSYHVENKNDLTVVASKKTQTFKYGSCHINKRGNLLKIHEKPTTSFLANTGLYIFNVKILKLIKKNQKIDMNVLIEKLIKKKFKVGVFPIHETEWQDLGNWIDFEEQIN